MTAAQMETAATGLTEDDLARARSFVQRHQWLVVSGDSWTFQGGCLLADATSGWTSSDFQKFGAEAKWTFARTMPQNPHEYALRRQAAAHGIFDAAVRFIRETGVIEMFAGRPYKMLFTATHKLWSMGDTVGETILINRKALSPAEQIDGPPTTPVRPKLSLILGAVEEEVLKSGCEHDRSDFWFMHELLSNHGDRSRGGRYASLTIDGYLFWTKGEARDVERIRRSLADHDLMRRLGWLGVALPVRRVLR